MRWTGAAWAAAGLIAGVALAPVGAVAEDGKPALMGRDNTSSGYTSFRFTGSPGAGGCNPLSECGLDNDFHHTFFSFDGGLYADDFDAYRVWSGGVKTGTLVVGDTLLEDAKAAGRSIYATNSSSNGTVTARNAGTGSAVYGQTTSTTSTSAAIIGAAGAKGRGAKLRGGAAQLLLEASTSSTHPASGTKGDLFVDSQGRLWFCKGGTNWKQIA